VGLIRNWAILFLIIFYTDIISALLQLKVYYYAVSYVNRTNATKNKTVCISSHRSRRIATERNRIRRTRRIYVGHDHSGNHGYNFRWPYWLTS